MDRQTGTRHLAVANRNITEGEARVSASLS